jgi:hypothetical protein
MKLKEGFLLRELAGSYVVVPVGKNIANFNIMITLNETSAFLWNLLKTSQTVQSLKEQLTQEYDVSPQTAEQDIAEFLQTLKEKDLLEED